jgi:hypothetical protein
MSTDESVDTSFLPSLCLILYRHDHDPTKVEAPDTDAIMQDALPTQATVAAAAAPKKRPRLDLTIEHRERKRGKSMFGLLVGTLNKAKTEDEARNASEAVRARARVLHHIASDIVPRPKSDS